MFEFLCSSTGAGEEKRSYGCCQFDHAKGLGMTLTESFTGALAGQARDRSPSVEGFIHSISTICGTPDGSTMTCVAYPYAG